MTDTTHKDFTKPTIGGDSNTWGLRLNENFDELDGYLGDVTAITLTASNDTLSKADQQSFAIISTGALSANVAVIFDEQGSWIFTNSCTQGAAETVTCRVGGSGGVVIPTGATRLIYHNGTNIAFAEGIGAGGETTNVIPKFDSTGSLVDSGMFEDGTSFSPLVNDDFALGTAALRWSDLFLADSAVLNYGAGGVTATHIAASDSLTYALDSGNALGSTQFIIAIDGANDFTLTGTAATFAGTLTSTGTLAATNAATVGTTLGVTGGFTASSTSALVGDVTFSGDLLVASGGVINFDSGDVTATHAANTLTFAGASTGYVFDSVITATAGTFSTTLGVTGDATFSGDLLVADNGVINWGTAGVTATHVAASDSLTIALDAANLAGSSTFKVAIDGADDFTLTATAATFAGTVTSTGALTSTGAFTASSTSSLVGDVTFSGDLLIAADSKISFESDDATITHDTTADTLTFAGMASYPFDGIIAGTAGTFSTTLGVTGDATFSGDLLIAADGVINFQSGDCTITHDTTADTLTFAGMTTYVFDSGATFADDITITSASPQITFIDSDTGSDSYIVADSGTGTLKIAADDNNEVASSTIGFHIDGTLQGYIIAGSPGRFQCGTDGQLSLGTSSVGWAHTYISDGGDVDWNGGEVVLSHANTDLHLIGLNTELHIKGTDTTGTRGMRIGDTTLTTGLCIVELGTGRTGDGGCRLDMIADGVTYTDYGFNISRAGGANGGTTFNHRGTGDVTFATSEAAGFVWDVVGSEAMRFTASATVPKLLIGKTAAGQSTQGTEIQSGTNDNQITICNSGAVTLKLNRLEDGTICDFLSDTNIEGTISISGTTTSYNAFAGSHWSQFSDLSEPEVLVGTVMETVNEMCEWNKNNDQLVKSAICDTPGCKNVYGVFMTWYKNDPVDPDDNSNHAKVATFQVTSLGAFLIRVAAGVTVEMGDYLEAAGGGCARPQADDILRSSTIAKVTCTIPKDVYPDGSYTVPCTLHCG